MKKTTSLIAAVALAGLSTPVLAHHFYAGFMAGADFLSVDKRLVQTTPLLPITSAHQQAVTGVIAQLFAGWDAQFTPTWDAAVEVFGNIESSKISASETNYRGTGLNVSATESLKGNVGAALEPGLHINQNTRVYGKAGVVWGEFASTSSSPNGPGALGFSGVLRKTVFGCIFGAGIESTFGKGMAVRVEYDHTEYNAFTTVSPDSVLPGFTNTIRYKLRSNTVMAGLVKSFVL